MCDHDLPPELRLPSLSDEAAVEILDFLHGVLTTVESRYSSQIRRYYDDRSRHKLIDPDQNLHPDDPLF